MDIIFFLHMKIMKCRSDVFIALASVGCYCFPTQNSVSASKFLFMAHWICLHFLNVEKPQGSVLGLVLFLMYTADLVSLVRTFGLFAYAYADDLQVYCHLSPGEEHVALQRFRSCSDSVSRWMSSNQLKLNPLKTELIWLHSSRRNPGFIQNDIELFDNFITPVTRVVHNLGVIPDESMTMLDHISSVCQRCYYQLRQIRRVRKSLSVASKLLLVLVSVHSRLDYCNSVLHSLPWSRLQLLQSVLNSAARLIHGLG